MRRDGVEEWKECRLGEICTKITDGSHFSPQACQTGYPMFSVKDMLEYGFDYSNCKHISAKDFESMKNGDCVPQKGDILVAKDGSFLKQIFECKETKEEAILSSIAMFRPNQDFITPTFLCYLLKSPKVYNYIASNCVSGSALPRIVLKDFKKVSMQVPPLPTQQKIAAILASLDDKIELNNKINTNLEQQARALFKNWFVDFEPFSGKMPEEWKVGKLSEILRLKKNPIQPGEDTSLPYLPIDLIPIKSLSIREVRPNEEALSSLLRFEENDILIGAMRVYFHRVAIAPFDGITRTTCFVLEPFNPKYFAYAAITCNQDLAIDYAQKTSKGSTMPYAVWEGGLGDFEIPIPDEVTAEKFNNIVEPFLEQIKKSYFENKNLQELRESLLPKLMNGEIEV